MNKHRALRLAGQTMFDAITTHALPMFSDEDQPKKVCIITPDTVRGPLWHRLTREDGSWLDTTVYSSVRAAFFAAKRDGWTVKLPAISVRTPWAQLLLEGGKPWETRINQTSHRGAIAIHVGNQADPAVMYFPGLDGIEYRGVVIGFATLTEEVKAEDVPWEEQRVKTSHPDQEEGMTFNGDYSPGRWAWRIAQPCKLAFPVEWTGNATWFDVEI